MNELQEELEMLLAESHELADEPTERAIVPILAGVAVSLVYVVAVTTVVVGLLRFTREYLRRLSAEEPSPSGLLARLPFRR